MSPHRYRNSKNHSAHHPLLIERMELRLAMDADGLAQYTLDPNLAPNTDATTSPEIRFNSTTTSHTLRPIGFQSPSSPSHHATPPHVLPSSIHLPVSNQSRLTPLGIDPSNEDPSNEPISPNPSHNHPSNQHPPAHSQADKDPIGKDPTRKDPSRPMKPSSPPEGEGPFTLPNPIAPPPATLEPSSSHPTSTDIPTTSIDRAPPSINDSNISSSHQSPNSIRDNSPSTPADSASLDLRPTLQAPEAEKNLLASPNNPLSPHDTPASALSIPNLNGSLDALYSTSPNPKSTSTLTDLKSISHFPDLPSPPNVATKPSSPFAIPSPTTNPYPSSNHAPTPLRVAPPPSSLPSRPSRSSSHPASQSKILEGWSQQAGFTWKSDAIEAPSPFTRESLAHSTQDLATFQYFAIGGSNFLTSPPIDENLDPALEPTNLDPNWLNSFLSEDDSTQSIHPARWLLSSSLFVGSAIWWLAHHANSAPTHAPALPRRSSSNLFPSRKSRRG